MASEFCEAENAFSLFRSSRVILQMENKNDTAIGPSDAFIRPRDAIGYGINLLNQLIILAITGYMGWICLRLRLVKTAFHAWFCTLGFVCLLAEGLMVRFGHNMLTAGMSSDDRSSLHFGLQLVGGLLGIVGTVQKVIGKKKHYHTLHGKFGLASCIFCVVNVLFGGAALFLPPDLYHQYMPPVVVRFVSNALGLATFAVVMIAQYYGYETGFFRRNFSHKNLWKFLTFVCFLLTALWPFKILLWGLKDLTTTQKFA